ncbi:MAG: type II/IV secretion system ATPase subunit [Halobacteriota archaeon]
MKINVHTEKSIPGHYKILEELYDGTNKSILNNKKPPENFEVIDEYWVVPGFSKIQIWRDHVDKFENNYILIEPPVCEEENSLLNSIYNDMRRSLVLNNYSTDEKTKTTVVMEVLDELIKEYALELKPELKMKILYYLLRNFIGFGNIDSILNDRYVEDISCDGYEIPLYIFHTRHGGMRTNLKFSRSQLDSLVTLLCQKSGKYISYANPLTDASLPDGSRLHASYGEEITPRGSSFTIRKFKEEPYTPVDLMNFGTLDSDILAYFWLLMEHKMNVMVIGETASGKTTTLNALTMFIPPESKIVSIEDTREIQLNHENWIAELTRLGIEGSGEISMYDLLKTTLRQRPDYLIVGEIRGVEGQTLFQAMSTGHSSHSTLHAGDMSQLIYRLESEPLKVPRIMIQFLDAVVVQNMWVGRGVRKRRANQISEIFGIDHTNKDLLLNPLYKWNSSKDSFISQSQSKKLKKISDISGESVSAILEEKERRKLFLEKMQKKGVNNYNDFSRFINIYYKDIQKATEKLDERAG